MGTFTVDKALCQASYDWQFVHEVAVCEQTERMVRIETTICLEERCPVRCTCEVEATEFRKGVPGVCNAVVRFTQGDTLTAEIVFTATMISPERETAIEDMFRDALLEHR